MAKRKLFSRAIELTVIRTLTLEPDSRAAQDLLAKLDDKHFASEIARAAYKRCLAGLRKNSTLPDWQDLISDPALDETVREDLEAVDYKPLVTKVRTRKAIDRLDEYKKTRLLNKIGGRIAHIMNSSEPLNVDDEIANVQSVMAESRSARNFKVLRIGKNSNAEKHVDKLLKGTAIRYLPTGFRGFDDINRGIPEGSFMLIGGPTGGGKSMILNQMSENLARQGAKVGTAPLEMSNDELLQRNLARVGQLDMTKLLDPIKKMTRQEHLDLRERFNKYDKKIEKAGGAVEFYEFDEDVTIETLTSTVKPFGLDVLMIDYLGLLDGASGDDQWRALMNIARYCHVWGKANKVSVIAAAQMSEEGMLRYAKGMAEHAKYFWTWRMDEVAKQTGIVTINQRKARQASDHDFHLFFDFPRMTVTDADKAAIEAAHERRKEDRQPRNEKGKEKTWKKDNSLSWDDDESETPAPKPGPRATNKKRSAPRKQEIEL